MDLERAPLCPLCGAPVDETELPDGFIARPPAVSEMHAAQSRRRIARLVGDRHVARKHRWRSIPGAQPRLRPFDPPGATTPLHPAERPTSRVPARGSVIVSNGWASEIDRVATIELLANTLRLASTNRDQTIVWLPKAAILRIVVRGDGHNPQAHHEHRARAAGEQPRPITTGLPNDPGSLPQGPMELAIYATNASVTLQFAEGWNDLMSSLLTDPCLARVVSLIGLPPPVASLGGKRTAGTRKDR